MNAEEVLGVPPEVQLTVVDDRSEVSTGGWIFGKHGLFLAVFDHHIYVDALRSHVVTVDPCRIVIDPCDLYARNPILGRNFLELYEKPLDVSTVHVETEPDPTFVV